MNPDHAAAVRSVARSRVSGRWRQLIAIGLVAGLIGGAALAALAGARRGSTAYDRLVETSAYPDLFVQLVEPRPGLADDVADLPSVQRAVPVVFAVGQRTDAPGQVLFPLQASAEPLADLPLVAGRSPDPAADDEVVLSPRFADELGLDVGDVVTHQALTDAEFADLLRDRWDGSASGVLSEIHIVGLVRAPTDVTLSEFPTMTGTPALHDRLAGSVTGSAGLWVHLRPGADGSAFDQDLATIIGDGSEERINAASTVDLVAERQRVDEATAVLSAGMVVFGLVTVLAGAVVLAQLISRTAETTRRDDVVLRDLGLDRRARRAAWILASWPVVVTAAVVALAVALVASAWTPLGVARSVEPNPGVDGNLVILAAGAAVLTLVVLGVWVAAARTDPDRIRQRRAGPAGRRRVVGGGPQTAVALAVARGATEHRSARWLGTAGIAASVAGIVAATSFGSSLDDLVEDPSRWGWFGDLSIEVPAPARDDIYEALDAAPEVDAYAEVRGIELSIEGTVVAAYSVHPRRGDIGPVVLRGRAPLSEGEIALGPRLSEQLGADIGDRISTDAGERTVVGLAPTFGLSERSDHVSGALLGGVIDGPDFTTAIVRVADGVDPEGFGGAVYPDAEYGTPAVPAEVANVGELAELPPLLAVTFGITGLVAAAHLARSAAARNRRDVAVLRSLGLSRRAAARAVLVATAGVVLVTAALAAPLGAVAASRAWWLAASGTDLGAQVTFPTALLSGLPVVVLVALVAGAAAGRRAVAGAVAGLLRTE